MSAVVLYYISGNTSLLLLSNTSTLPIHPHPPEITQFDLIRSSLEADKVHASPIKIYLSATTSLAQWHSNYITHTTSLELFHLSIFVRTVSPDLLHLKYFNSTSLQLPNILAELDTLPLNCFFFALLNCFICS